ncbi:hypothetical protein vseg_006648 [Gypsophila vaccaria]
MSGNNVKLQLKLMVDTEARKVVFAEADKYFVDFIFHILSLPLGTVAKLLKYRGSSGCIGSVYNSFNSLPSDYFQPTLNRSTVFNPNIDAIVPLLSLINTPSTTLYMCTSHS